MVNMNSFILEVDNGTQTPFWWTFWDTDTLSYDVDDAEPNCKSTQTDFRLRRRVPCLLTKPLKGSGVKDRLEDNIKGKKIISALKEVGKFVAKTALVSGGILAGISLAVPALGFTAGGIAAGSLAASYQSAVLGGNIAAGSFFAKCQSIGAAGLAEGTQTAIVGCSGAAVGVQTAASKIIKKINSSQ